MKDAVIRLFSSRRNRVRLMKGSAGLVVEKTCHSVSSAKKEAAVYHLLEGGKVKTASLEGRAGNRLFLSFVEGEDYLTVLERQEREGFSLEPWQALFEWLACFHDTTGMIQRDMNLRNFLWSDGETVGIDFEDCGSGTLMDMSVKLAAYVLLYDPPFTHTKKDAAACIQNCLMKRFNVSENDYTCRLILETQKLVRHRQRIRQRF